MLRTELIRPLPELLSGHALRRGEAVAFEDGRRAVTYAELYERTGRIAGHLTGLRLHPGDRAAILLGDRVETVESYLALVRAAAIGVPVDPCCSDGELEHILERSGARLILTDRAHLPQLARLRAGRAATIVVVDDKMEEVSELSDAALPFETLAGPEPAAAPRDDLRLDDVAWMIHTAGTSGRPKGVLSTQRNCLWSVAAGYAPVLGLDPQDRVLWPLPLTHSLGHIVGVLAVAAVGARARITGPVPHAELLRLWTAERPTLIAGVPTTYHGLLREARALDAPPPRPRVFLVGGAPTTPLLRAQVEQAFGAPLVDAYGSTETSGSVATTWPGSARLLPVPGLAVRLVDPAAGTDVPDGAPGEVWVRGPNVMAGYHDRPAETAEALRGGWYRTGDLARRDPDGFLELGARITDLIIRAGENIDPGEVEEAVRSVPGVADAAVVGRPHDVLGQIPVAFVVPGPGGFDPERVLAVCRERLSPAKVPQEVYEIARIPRAASGKTTRRRLLEVRTRLRAVSGSHYPALFRLDWVPVPDGPPTAGRPGASAREPWRWTVIGAEDGAGGQAVRELERAGFPAPTLHPSLANLLRGSRTAGEPAPDAVLWVVPDEPPVPAVRGFAAKARALGDRLRRLAAALDDPRLSDTLLVVATRGAVATSPDEGGQAPEQAALWGAVRSLQASYPDRIALVDFDETQDGDDAAPAAWWPALAAGEHQLAVRRGITLAARLARVATGADRGPGIVPPPGGAAVVTGADTARGAALARHLAAAYGLARVLLVTEPGRGALATAVRAQLAGSGVQSRIAECAPADRAGLARALAELGAPVSIAACARDFARLPAAEALLEAEAAGRNLYELAGTGLSVLLLCASAEGLLGTAGAPPSAGAAVQAAFHEAFARDLRERGAACIALEFGPWDAGTDGPAGRQALAMLDAALAFNHVHLIAAALDGAATADGRIAPVLRDLVDCAEPSAR
jgi:rifamycin polyketide synthase modules 1, 2 and 3